MCTHARTAYLCLEDVGCLLEQQLRRAPRAHGIVERVLRLLFFVHFGAGDDAVKLALKACNCSFRVQGEAVGGFLRWRGARVDKPLLGDRVRAHVLHVDGDRRLEQRELGRGAMVVFSVGAVKTC